MQAATVNNVSSQGQELRYLIAHFRDLQGLRMAPFWLALLALTSLARAGSFSRTHLAWSADVVIALQFGWLYFAGRWYDRRFGVVIEPEQPVVSGFISIMHAEVRPQHAANPLARRYGYLSGLNAVLFLLWAFLIVPDIFKGHWPGYWQLVLFVTVFHIFPRCVYPVITNKPVLLRRVFAATATIVMITIYLGFRFGRMDLWIWMTLLLILPLLLDLYDHWLLNHLLGRDFTEPSHE